MTFQPWYGSVCTTCGIPRGCTGPAFEQHQRSSQHREAVARWDCRHGPPPTHHDGHRLLGIACHCEAKVAA